MQSCGSPGGRPAVDTEHGHSPGPGLRLRRNSGRTQVRWLCKSTEEGQVPTTELDELDREYVTCIRLSISGAIA